MEPEHWFAACHPDRQCVFFRRDVVGSSPCSRTPRVRHRSGRCSRCRLEGAHPVGVPRPGTKDGGRTGRRNRQKPGSLCIRERICRDDLSRWGVGSAQREHGIVILAAVQERRAAVTVGKPLIARITPAMAEEAGRQYIDPAFRQGEFGEGLYRTVVSLASGLQDIRAGEPPRSHLKGVGAILTVLTGIGAFAFLWWISRPDLRHPFGRIRRGEFWGSGQGGFRGNFGGFGEERAAKGSSDLILFVTWNFSYSPNTI